MSTVSVNTYTHSVTYVSDNILKSIKDIIKLSGLDPSNFVESWPDNSKAIQTWINSGHLERVVLEIYDPKTDILIKRWDIDITYSWSAGDGTFYTDTEQIKYAIIKAGVAPGSAKYKLLLDTKTGKPTVEGWGPGTYRSTDHMVKQSLGSTIEHSGLGGNAGYWRPK